MVQSSTVTHRETDEQRQDIDWFNAVRAEYSSFQSRPIYDATCQEHKDPQWRRNQEQRETETSSSPTKHSEVRRQCEFDPSGNGHSDIW